MRSYKLPIWTALAALSTLHLSKGFAETDFWTGSSSNVLNLPDNWSPNEPLQPPSPGDQAVFGAVTNISPTLSDGSPFSLYQALFTEPDTAYQFAISNGSQLIFGLADDTDPQLISGISNNIPINSQQELTVTENSSILFQGFSSANQNDDMSVLYFIGGTSLGSMTFTNQATAGHSGILIVNASVDHSAVNFYDSSTAGNSLISAGFGNLSGAGLLSFHDQSTAGSSILIIGDVTLFTNNPGVLSFYDASSGGNSTINVGDHLGDSSVHFYGDSDTVFSTAESSNIIVGHLLFAPKSLDGSLFFHGYSTAGQATITIADENWRSTAYFQDNSSAGSSTITVGDVGANFGGNLHFLDFSTAANSQIFVTNGSSLIFYPGSSGGEASITLSNGGILSMEGPASYSIGSLSSDALSFIELSESELTLDYKGVSPITIAGTFSGTGGSFIKKGSGTLLLNAICTYSGKTTLEEGSLVHNGSIAQDVLITGGTFSGTGSIGGSLTVTGGVFAPGNSPGTIVIGGNYTQNNTSTYSVQLENNLSSLIEVGGSASLDHSPVSIVLLDNNFTLQSPYLILETQEEISGSFTKPSVDFLSSGINEKLLGATVSYAQNKQAFITLAPTLTNVAVTPNQTNAAKRWDSLTNPNNKETSFLNELIRLSTNKARLALDQLSGEPYANWLFSQERTSQRFLRSLYEPLRSEVIGSPCSSCEENSLSIWVDGGVGRNFLDSRKGFGGLKTNSYNTNLGIHKKIGFEWTLGVAGSYEQDKSFYRIGGYGTGRSGLGGIYSLYRPKLAYLLMDLIGGYTQNKIHRFVEVNKESFTASGKAKIGQVGLYTETGFDIPSEYILLQPFLGLQGNHYHLRKTQEHGSYPVALTLEEKNRNTANSRLGVHITNRPKDCRFYFGLDLAWQCLLTAQNQEMESRFQAFGHAFNVSGVPLQRNSIEGSAIFQMPVKDHWNVFAKASGQKWKNAETYDLLLGIETSW